MVEYKPVNLADERSAVCDGAVYCGEQLHDFLNEINFLREALRQVVEKGNVRIATYTVLANNGVRTYTDRLCSRGYQTDNIPAELAAYLAHGTETRQTERDAVEETNRAKPKTASGQPKEEGK